MIWSYHTSGLITHPLPIALSMIAEAGYGGAAITIDHHQLPPGSTGAELADCRSRLETLGLSAVLETGARYLLDPWRKHAPALVDEDSGPRLRLIERALEMASALGAPVVSCWSGVAPAGAGRAVLRERLLRALAPLAEQAQARGIRLGLEPEPGMFVETIADYLDIEAALDSPALGLTLDLGHLLVTGEAEPPAAITEQARRLVHVHIEDMRRGVHEHLPLGEGDLPLAETLAALRSSGYRGQAALELSRNIHDGPIQLRRSLEILRAACGEARWRSPAAKRPSERPAGKEGFWVRPEAGP